MSANGRWDLIRRLKVKGKFFNYTIINVHAPTEVSAEEEKDSFYDLLHKTYEQSPSYDVKIVIGDINLQVGKEEMYCPTIGKKVYMRRQMIMVIA